MSSGSSGIDASRLCFSIYRLHGLHVHAFRYESQWVIIMASVAQRHAETQAAARVAQETLHQVSARVF
jgi:hypothetical protein